MTMERMGSVVAMSIGATLFTSAVLHGYGVGWAIAVGVPCGAAVLYVAFGRWTKS